jgi:hypothetical protein
MFRKTLGLSLVLLIGVLPVSVLADPPTGPTVTVDNTELDTVNAYAAKAKAIVTEWYPRIVEILGAQKATPLKNVTIYMDTQMDIPAATGGDTIHVSVRYVEKHPDDTGMIVHELTHAVQGYPKYDPVWLVEGIADYVRFFHYEPEAKRPHPNPAKAHCRDSYRVTGAFLDWACRTYDVDLVKKLDAALKADTYTEDLFKKLTGKTLDQLDMEWIASLK